MADPVTRAEYDTLHQEVLRMRDRLHALGTVVTKLEIQQRRHRDERRQETQRTVGVSAAAGTVVAGAVYGLLQYFFGHRP